jgi:hypothetical protein
MSYIDTRDLAAELAELQDRQDAVDAAAIEVAGEVDELDPLDEDEANRLAELRELADEIGEEFPHGETMIPVAEFEEYAEEYAEDIGAIDRNASWPLSHIDWAAAAEELAQGYTEVEWEGTSYYVRTS